jgi:hypothetical protein
VFHGDGTAAAGGDLLDKFAANAAKKGAPRPQSMREQLAAGRSWAEA